jgi:hypothetical protein
MMRNETDISQRLYRNDIWATLIMKSKSQLQTHSGIQSNTDRMSISIEKMLQNVYDWSLLKRILNGCFCLKKKVKMTTAFSLVFVSSPCLYHKLMHISVEDMILPYHNQVEMVTSAKFDFFYFFLQQHESSLGQSVFSQFFIHFRKNDWNKRSYWYMWSQ